MAPGLTKLLHFCYKKAVFAPAKRVLKNCQNAAVDMSKDKNKSGQQRGEHLGEMDASGHFECNEELLRKNSN
ncbi:hypothetical protein T4C_1012 [Trichinella pseudospiralis]|uniref:Uncharacterized protein n=2 Tax=Trichinella TaxID=6333 RepID=A0A0V1IET7_TRIPS|nr:hypothetical protein T4C_8518 [Trichinella pseudospiralis]KRZ21289.1 hypothetical protein T4C_5579 [Trichinella pseudospiralis]KRZ21327.1 hypothetical protein T4C_1012 [Trichinella pseudospiralis]KRZ65135.1 hypothetical protein T10_11981 [Trichinella papuae]